MDERVKGIEFIEATHEYWFVDKEGKHRQLHGVTGAIGKILGKNFPDTVTVQIATIYGHDIHKDCEMWIKEGREPFHEGSIWLVDYLKDFKEQNKVVAYEAELLVSDFEGTASSIDIVAHFADGSAVLFDIKTTATFHREYCSLQLSVYKKLYEDIYGGNVTAMYVLGTKSKRAYRILPQSEAKVAKILNMNKEQV